MEDNNFVRLGRRISELRQAKRMSQERLSELAGISAHHIGELERGKSKNPTYQVLTKLADALDVSVLMLLDFEHQKEKQDLQEELIALIRNLPEDKLKMVYRLVRSVIE